MPTTMATDSSTIQLSYQAAILLAACEDGLNHQISPGDPTVGSSYDATPDPRFARLPLTLGDAIEAFRGDQLIRDTFGDERTDLLIDYKTDEWARFCGYVTDWEKQMFWDDTP